MAPKSEPSPPYKPQSLSLSHILYRPRKLFSSIALQGLFCTTFEFSALKCDHRINTADLELGSLQQSDELFLKYQMQINVKVDCPGFPVRICYYGDRNFTRYS